MGHTVALVLVAREPWVMREVSPLLPRQPEPDPMETARSLVGPLTEGRAIDAWAAYLVRF